MCDAMTVKKCRIDGCREPAVEGYMPFRCAHHKVDRIRKQKASDRANYISSASGSKRCPDCGTPFDEVSFNPMCDGHARWNAYQNEKTAREIAAGKEAKRADADRAMAMLEALRDVYGIDLLSKASS